MSGVNGSGSFKVGQRMVKRLGFGAMQLAGRGVFGPPKITPGRWRYYARLFRAV